MLDKRVVPGFKIMLAAALLATMTACATTAQLEQAQSDAAEAREQAASAQSAASEAAQVAREAMEAARAAQRSADAAQRCCTDLSERLDRAVERMQQK